LHAKNYEHNFTLLLVIKEKLGDTFWDAWQNIVIFT